MTMRPSARIFQQVFLLAALMGSVVGTRAETVVSILPFERDDQPRQNYLRSESPLIRVRFQSDNAIPTVARGRLSLQLSGENVRTISYLQKFPAQGVSEYSVRMPLQNFRTAKYRLWATGTISGQTPAKSFHAEAPLWICPNPERAGFTFAMLDDQVRTGDALEEYLQKLRALGLTGIMHYNVTTPLLERSLWHGLNVMSVSHGDAAAAGYQTPLESRWRLNASGQPFLNYGSTTTRGRWGIADTDWQDASARSLEKNIAALIPYPAYDPRIMSGDDYFQWSGLDYNPANVRRFQEKYGMEPPRPPEALANDFPQNVARPKGIIADDDAWLLWLRFLSRDVLGRYNQQLTAGVLRATGGQGKIGPLPGGGPVGHRGQMGLTPLIETESGQWPAYNFGANGFNLISYYNYNSYFYPALTQVYWAEMGRMGNRSQRLQQWLMPDTWDANASYHLHNWHLFMAGDLQGLVYFIHGQTSPGSETAFKQIGPRTRRYRHLLGNLQPVPRKIGLMMPYENSIFRAASAVDASYAFGNLLMAHAEVEPVMPEELPDRAAQYKLILLHDVDWLTVSNLKILQSYIAGGGRVFVDSLCEVEVPGAERLEFSLGEADRNAGYGDVKKIAEIKSAVERAVKPWAQSDNPHLLLRHFRRENVDYLWVVNLMSREEDAARIPPNPPLQPNSPPDPAHLNNRKVRGGISVPLPNAVAYDVLNGRAIAATRTAGVLRLPIETGLWQGALIAFYPQTPNSLRVTAPRNAKAGERFQVRCEVFSNQKTLPAAMPLEISVIDPNGAVSAEYSGSAMTQRGVYNLRLPLAKNELRGQWKLKIRELSTGLERNLSFTVV